MSDVGGLLVLAAGAALLTGLLLCLALLLPAGGLRLVALGLIGGSGSGSCCYARVDRPNVGAASHSGIDIARLIEEAAVRYDAWENAPQLECLCSWTLVDDNAGEARFVPFV
jgi:hypothetical protein